MDDFYRKIFQCVPLGLFVLDAEHRIIAWNAWMASKTKLSEEWVMKKPIETLFPEANYNRFHWALEQVLVYGSPQIISQVLNHYLIPITLEANKREGIDKMQQHVEIFPIKKDDAQMALVIIRDVTNDVYQRNTLMLMAGKLEDESDHDALTGIYNRRNFWEMLSDQIEHAKRTNESIACVMFDLDFFKKVNDQYGHKRGDLLLIDFVKVVKSIVRSRDIFFRYGGEEFVALLPGCTIENAVRIAENIRKQFEANSNVMVDDHPATCSAGISLWDSHNLHLSPQELVHLSDQALYKAKENGRNRVEIAE